MNKTSNHLILFLTKSIELTNEQRDAFSYGLEVFIYTVLSTTALILYGIVWDQTKATIILIGVFYTNQTVGGGFHAKTHVKCMLTMIIGLSFALTILNINSIPSIVFRCIGFLGCVLLFIFPLVLHKNKKYLAYRKKALIKRSFTVLIIESLAIAITAFFDVNLCNAALVGLFLSGISRFAGYTINKMDID